MTLPFSVQGLTRRSPEAIESLLVRNKVSFTFISTKPVFTCREAAIARGVPLHNELKTLLVVYRGDLALLNLPGNRQVDRRSVRIALMARDFRLANTVELATLRLTRGIISPLSLIGCRSLLDTEVLDLEWITTNAGSLTVGIKIAVRDLLRICEFQVVKMTQ